MKSSEAQRGLGLVFASLSVIGICAQLLLNTVFAFFWPRVPWIGPGSLSWFLVAAFTMYIGFRGNRSGIAGVGCMLCIITLYCWVVNSS